MWSFSVLNTIGIVAAIVIMSSGLVSLYAIVMSVSLFFSWVKHKRRSAMNDDVDFDDWKVGNPDRRIADDAKPLRLDE